MNGFTGIRPMQRFLCLEERAIEGENIDITRSYKMLQNSFEML